MRMVRAIAPAILSFAIASLLAVAPARAADTVTIGTVGSPSANLWPLFIGVEKGFYTAENVKPDLVYCSISGFGQTGPWRSRPAFAHIIHAASGLMHLEQGELDAPRSANLQAADVLAGTHAFGAILAALWRRARKPSRVPWARCPISSGAIEPEL